MPSRSAGRRRVPPTPVAPPDALDAVARRAATDAGLPVALLGTYLAELAAAADTGQLLGAAELAGHRASGRAAAEGGASLDALVDLYLSATWRAWPLLPAVATTTDIARLRDRTVGVLRATDDALAALCDGYAQARRSAARAEEALRREFVDDLLTGTGEVAAVLERAAAFGLRLEAAHRVLVVAGSRPFLDGRVMVRDVESALVADAAGAPPDLLVATRHGLLVCVVPSTRSVTDLLASRLRREASLRWRVGVSRSRVGAAGVRASYQEARTTVDLARRIDLDRPVVAAEELLVYQVLLRDREALVDLVQAVLSPLTQARGGAAPLLDTLWAYYSCGAVAVAAAKQLHLSVRAVTYRLARIAALTGHDPADPEDRYALETALRGARLLGWAAAGPAADTAADAVADTVGPVADEQQRRGRGTAGR